MANEFEQFVEDCRKVARLYGEVKHGKREFDDGGLHIEDWMNGNVDVTYTYRRRSGGLLSNPVIMIRNGEIIRDHGEWTYGQSRVHGYLNDPVLTKLAAGYIDSHYEQQD